MARSTSDGDDIERIRRLNCIVWHVGRTIGTVSSRAGPQLVGLARSTHRPVGAERANGSRANGRPSEGVGTVKKPEPGLPGPSCIIRR
jgi:hypothetical protein